MQMTLPLFDFKHPFDTALDSENRWVRLAALIPWDSFEEEYGRNFGIKGNDAYSVRVALGSLIIKERLRLTDEETVAQIGENPYLQYFIGMTAYSTTSPFDPSLMVHFRARISAQMLQRVNEAICIPKKAEQQNHDDDPSNKGTLIIDATCAPEDMRHPTDIALLNDSREHSERIIDHLWSQSNQRCRKPLTYREKARRQFLKAIRCRKPSGKHIRKGIRQQLGFLKRNLSTIRTLQHKVSLSVLKTQDYRKLLVASEIYRQQSELYKLFGSGHRRIDDRIVSLSKPHVRPIVRGKASADVEFGAKLSVSVIDGKTYLDRLSWDAYNEGAELHMQAEMYKKKTGVYPASIHADKAYRNRENLRWCRERGIRLSGPLLGRPVVEVGDQAARRKQQRLDEIKRIEVEGRFGTAKRRYGLGRIMTKLRSTSETTIALIFLVMNLDKILRDLLLSLFVWLFGEYKNQWRLQW
jgi:hypothetical protein